MVISLWWGVCCTYTERLARGREAGTDFEGRGLLGSRVGSGHHDGGGEDGNDVGELHLEGLR